MNSKNGQDSTITLMVPYSNGDAVKGFQYNGAELSQQQYSRMMVDTYNKYKNGVWDTYVERAGMNMAINNYEKEIVHYAQQQYYYDETKVNLYNGQGEAMTIDELIHYYQTSAPFILIIDMYKMNEYPDLESEMKTWLKECIKLKGVDIYGNPIFSDAERIQYASKKNMKIKFDDAKSQAILQNCKMMDYKNKHTFVYIVEKIIFITT